MFRNPLAQRDGLMRKSERISVESPAQSVLAEVPTPSLCISHLMLWTLCSAIYLALVRAIYSAQGDIGMYGAVQEASGLIHSMIAGAVLTGAIILVTMRVRGGPPMLRHPGHWLLFIAAIMSLLTLALFFLLLFVGELENGGGNSFLLVFGVLFLFPTIAFAFAARRTRSRWWSILFIALLLLSLSRSLFYLGIGVSFAVGFDWISILSIITTWGGLALAAPLLALSILDFKIGPQRDWLHWNGVATQLASSIANVLWMFA